MPSSSAPASLRAARIRDGLEPSGHITDYFAHLGQCSVGEATVELLRLERAGVATRGRSGYGMTWMLLEHSSGEADR